MKKFFKQVSTKLKGNDVKCSISMTFLNIYAQVDKPILMQLKFIRGKEILEGKRFKVTPE
jgi:hypothetical protein